MTWSTWTLYLVTDTVICLTPGPAVLFVVSHGLGGRGRAWFWAALGILAGNVAYFTLSATSLGAVLVASYDLFSAVKWAGAAYLVWLGLRALVGDGTRLAAARATADGTSGLRLVGRGFLVQAANPKALLFFVALLPQFVDPRGSVAVQIAVLALTGLIVELSVLSLYGALAARAADAVATSRAPAVLERSAGALMIVAGVRMVAADHPG